MLLYIQKDTCTASILARWDISLRDYKIQKKCHVTHDKEHRAGWIGLMCGLDVYAFRRYLLWKRSKCCAKVLSQKGRPKRLS